MNKTRICDVSKQFSVVLTIQWSIFSRRLFLLEKLILILWEGLFEFQHPYSLDQLYLLQTNCKWAPLFSINTRWSFYDGFGKKSELPWLSHFFRAIRHAFLSYSFWGYFDFKISLKVYGKIPRWIKKWISWIFKLLIFLFQSVHLCVEILYPKWPSVRVILHGTQASLFHSNVRWPIALLQVFFRQRMAFMLRKENYRMTCQRKELLFVICSPYIFFNIQYK